MILTTINELRLAFPTHALDDVAPLTGFIENSEHEILYDKLGRHLYEELVEYYNTIDKTSEDYINADSRSMFPMAKLLRLCQRAVAFDAM